MTALEVAAALDTEQARAVAHPRAGGSLAIGGPAGTGKTFALVARARRLAAQGRILVTAPSDFGVARLRERLAADGICETIACESFGATAFALLCAARPQDDLELIDDVRASLHFESSGAQLFALEWTEFVSAEIDPEITGLRAPERFSAAAFRLFRKLRAALVSPEAFKTLGLRGAAAFYANPPNLASADIIMATATKYRDSLRVTPEELERQRRREVDLVKILARLYGSYVETLVAHGAFTPTDAVYEAVMLLRAHPELGAGARARFTALLVDDAQDLTAAQNALLEAIGADALGNVTVAGDAAQNTRGFAAGGRGIERLEKAAHVVVLERRYRSAPAIERAARIALEPTAAPGAPAAAGTVALYRADNMRDEARTVASEIARAIAAGTPAHAIAVVTRNLRCAGIYVDALLARDIAADVGGSASLYDFPAVGDAFAALWPVVDPYRHDYLLRALQAPWLALSDATLAVLCADAAEPQPLLFELPDDDANGTRDRRWDPRRNVRLGRNVTRGDVDTDLPSDARERLAAFRGALGRYESLGRTCDAAELARIILDETVLATSRDDARGRFERNLVARLQGEIEAIVARDPLATLADVLLRLEEVAAAEDDLLWLAPRDPGAVRVLDVEAAKGESFDAVFVVDVRAGAWPRYYVPDAFLFMPSAGMIPKENVGDARTARTAKFTYMLFRQRLREKYHAEDRLALYTAMTRARHYICISTSGRATRGVAAPEFFEELRAKLER